MFPNDSQTGWIETEDGKSNGMPDGSLREGWLSFGNTYYYCDNTGIVVIDDFAIDGILYTFNKNNTIYHLFCVYHIR